ncbi:DUF2252 domain-containing protein [Agromyces sp. NPDC004153]
MADTSITTPRAGDQAPRDERPGADATPGRMSDRDRAARGKAARATTPLGAHADFRRSDEVDPIALLLGQAETRVQELVPIRHGRMLVSPFTFYRGAALVMAADLAGTSTSGLETQLCGDAHLSNFGGYASPERRLVFDINDFDETFPGPFEWDVKRLAASFVVAGRDNGFTAKQSRTVTRAAVESYRIAIRTFATQPILTVWYAHLEIEDAIDRFAASLSDRERKGHKAAVKDAQKALAKAHTRDSLQALDKLTTVIDGQPRIVSTPPLITRLDDMTGLDTDDLLQRLTTLIADYRDTLTADRRRLFDHFELVDVAHKVVGVGSVGTRAWVLLFQGGVEGEVLLLQAKQAQRSVLADFVPDLGAASPAPMDPADPRGHAHEGRRVVIGQRLMQASSDIFLGWLRATPTGQGEQDYYLRQLRDWKVSAEIEQLTPSSMETYARLCGWTLARAHARAGDRVAIAAYLGKSDRFDRAIGDFAETYADQNERDHASLVAAVDSGRVQAQSGL